MPVHQKITKKMHFVFPAKIDTALCESRILRTAKAQGMEALLAREGRDPMALGLKANGIIIERKSELEFYLYYIENNELKVKKLVKDFSHYIRDISF